MTGNLLLDPGHWRSSASTDDDAVLRALLEVEVAWLRVQRTLGVVDDAAVEAVAAAASAGIDLPAIARRAELAGNPVVPLVADLRAAVGAVSPEAARAIHRGLTSQDTLDTALMLVARTVIVQLRGSLGTAASALAGLADAHRETLVVGRTLGQSALPTTFGLQAATWLGAVTDAIEELDAIATSLPVQCGGAVGTLAAIDALVPGEAMRAADLLADELGLVSRGRPWHTDRGPVTRCGDALVRAADVMGTIAADVVLRSRPEIGELAEPTVTGRGASSTLPQKRNPVLSVLIRSVALEAPHLGAVLHTCAALAVDERPDGAWHAEWGVLMRLLARVASAGAQLAELLAGLEVRPATMRRHVDAAGPALVAERIAATIRDLTGASDLGDVLPLLAVGAPTDVVRGALRTRFGDAVIDDAVLDRLLDPSGYTGVGDALIDRALERYRAREPHHELDRDAAGGRRHPDGGAR
jgi:3-carboxy-cis,cis-muconate cycloisomerase